MDTDNYDYENLIREGKYTSASYDCPLLKSSLRKSFSMGTKKIEMLAKKACVGGIKGRKALCEISIGYGHRAASRLIPTIKEVNPCTSYSDILSGALFGLAIAANKYRPRHKSNASFRTYSFKYINGKAIEALAKERFFHIPEKKNRKIIHCQKNGILSKELKEIELFSQHPMSLDYLKEEYSNEDNESQNFQLSKWAREIMNKEDTTRPKQECLLETRSIMEFIEKELNRLPKGDKDVISMRFGLNGEPPKTLEEIGLKIHRTKENARRKINSIIKHLGYKLKQSELKSQCI